MKHKIKLLSALLLTAVTVSSMSFLSFADEYDDEQSNNQSNYEDDSQSYGETYTDYLALEQDDSVGLTYAFGFSSPEHFTITASNKGIVSFDKEENYIKGIAPGQTTLTAKSNIDGGDTYILYVSVTAKQAQGQTYKSNYYMSEGESDSVENVFGLYDSTAYDYSSSNSSVATASLAQGAVFAHRAGSCTLTATSKYAGGDTYIVNLTVGGSSYNYTNKNVSVPKGDIVYLSDYVDGYGTDYDWYCDDTSIATVNSSGDAKGKAKGTVYIYAEDKYSNTAYKFKVTVTNSSSSSSSSSSAKNISYKYSYDIYLSKNDTVDLDEYLLSSSANNYTWVVDDTSVANVNKSSGVVTAKGNGTTYIAAKRSNDNVRFKINVAGSYSTDELSLKVGESADLSDALSGRASNYSCTSNATKVVSVNGLEITAKSQGKTYLIIKNKSNDEIIQIMVSVSGTALTTQKVVEKTTETTTREVEQKTTKAPVQSSKKNDVAFGDISHRDWAVEAINHMAELGFINGRSKYVFAPDDSCSKADFSIVLVKLLGFENNETSGNFADVNSSDYFAKYVAVVKERDMGAGVNNNNFYPRNAITREEIMYMVFRGLENAGVHLNPDTSVLDKYTDSANISEQYRIAVAALINEDIVSGTSATTIDPKATITRAQMAVLLDNVYDELD